MTNNNTTIAVDGGAASGKSSTSRAIAERFNFLHVDTGSHYRSVTFSLLENQVGENEIDVKSFLANIPLDTKISGQQAIISINQKVINPSELRSAEINAKVSIYAAMPTVRQFLFNYQRSQREVAVNNKFNGLIMEGRDIGSIIFPDASLRIFLEADPETRAKRRAAEGLSDAIKERDRLDKSRKAAPLTCADGAIKIDTGRFTLDEVVNEISNMITSLKD